MAQVKGRRKRQREALENEINLSTSKSDIHARLAEKISEKLKKRGEWKYKTKRRMTAAAARSKSKKGKGGGSK